MSESEYQYVTGQARDTFPELFRTFEAANAEVLATRRWQLDVSYGMHQRQRFDLCGASGEAIGNFIYIHAGYWQSRDKEQFRFIAAPLCDAGFNVAIINYPLCPDVSLRGLTAGVRLALPAISAALSNRERSLPLIVGGHSAGGHLAVELALGQDFNTPDQLRIRGVVAISGIYDLQPLVETSLNSNLKLNLAEALANSPLRRARAGMPAATFVVGGGETSAFREQSKNMSRAWHDAGNVSEYLPVGAADHFGVLDVLRKPGGQLVEIAHQFVSSN
jgi:arylformamidase